MKTLLKIVGGGLLLTLALGACELEKLANQATASAVAVGTVLYSPPIEVKGAALAIDLGIDAGLPDLDLDAGLLADAGFTLADAGVTVPEQTLVTLFFGTKGASLDSAPSGVAGATAELREVGGASYPLMDQGGGNYGLGADAGFTYSSGATYEFSIVNAGTTYVANVERAPSVENITAFHPPEGYVSLPAQSAFSFTRPEPPAGQELPLAFVTVLPVSKDGPGEPTWTDLPSEPLQFLKLVVAPGDWRKRAVEIPASAFPEADANYVVILQSVKLGGPKSDNLFAGGPVLAGVADVAIIKTH